MSNEAVEMPETRRATSETGQAVYSPLVLAIYDFFVLGLFNRYLWRCPTAELRALYDRNVGPRHLDIGVATGYYLDHAQWPVPNPEITLLDLNANCLTAAARRIARYAPHTVRADAMKPLPDLGRFSSVGLTYLLHCLPGALPEKAIVFDNIKKLLAPKARVFGATMVDDGKRGPFATRFNNRYNAKGFTSTRDDRFDDLKAILEARFDDVRVELRGTVAVFEASAP
jgi:SAM-dependent methyltransferase